MHEWLVAVTNGTVLVIDAMVLVIIAIGTIQTFARWPRLQHTRDQGSRGKPRYRSSSHAGNAGPDKRHPPFAIGGGECREPRVPISAWFRKKGEIT
jgi:hypothetical protein